MSRHTLHYWMHRLLGTRPGIPDQAEATAPHARATFELRLNSLVIGVLSLEDGRWTFRYSDELREHREVRPLPIFPDISQTYQSDELWSFFKMRVPSLKQPAINEIVMNEGIDANDQVQLLRRFGRRTVSNPFELVEDRGTAPKAIAPKQ